MRRRQPKRSHSKAVKIVELVLDTLEIAHTVSVAVSEGVDEQLVSREQPDSDDLKNYGYCLWLQGQVGKAVELFRQCCQHHEQTPIDKFFDVEWLKKRGITMVDINMMLATL